jgi:hypothetical protein
MLVLDIIMEEGRASSAVHQLLHPLREASRPDTSKKLESMLGHAVFQAADEIKIQTGGQV